MLLFSTVHRLRHVVKLRTPDHRNTGTPEHRNTKNDKDQRKNKLFKKIQLGERFGFPLASSFAVTVARDRSRTALSPIFIFYFIFRFQEVREKIEDCRRLTKMSEDFHEEIRKFSTSFLSLYSHGKEIVFAVYRFEILRGEKSL